MSTTTAADTTARTVLPGAAMIAVTFGWARYGYGLLLPDMQSDLGLTPGAAGVISSSAYLSYLLANVAVVPLTSRSGPRLAIALAAILAAAGMVTVGLAGTAPVLAAGVFVSGAAAGLAFPPYAEVVARRVREGRRDSSWAVISSGTGWGVAVAGPIAVAAGEQWRAAWMAFVAVTVAVGVVATVLAPGRPGGGRGARPQLSWTWFVCPRSRPLLLSAVLVGAGSAVWWAFSVDALREAGIGATAARIVYAGCGAAGILASASGTVFGRFGLRGSYLAACAVLAGSLALLGVAAGRLPAAIAAAVLFGVFYNTVVAAQGVWSTRVFADHPAAGLAAVNVALTIGTVTGPSLAGLAVGAVGFSSTLLVTAGVVLAALPFCPPGLRRRRVLAAHTCNAVRPED